VPHLCEFYPGICLTSEEKARKNLSQGSRRVIVYILHITKTSTHYELHTTTEAKGYFSVTNYVVFWDLVTCNLVGRVCCLLCRASSVLEAVGFSETSVLINKNAPRYFVKDSNLYSYHCEGFRFLASNVNLQAPCVLCLGQAFRQSPENASDIFNQQIYFII